MASYEVGTLVWKITGDSSGLDQSLKKSESGFSKIISTAKGFLGLGLVAGFASIAKTALKGASDLEQQNVAFTTLLGSASKAKALIGELRDLAAFTPFSQSDLIQNAKLLLNFGVQSKDVTDTLSRLGDVASGDANKLNSLTLAFAQSASAGRLNGQDLLQMINAGFNPLQEIAEKTGKSMAQLRKEMEQGRIGIDQVKGAFVSATSEGGRFYQMNQKQSETLAGQWSTLQDNIEVFLTKLGQIEAKPIKELVGGLNELLTLLNKGNINFGIFGDVIEASFKPLNLLIDGIVASADAFGISKDATTELTEELARLEAEEQRYIRLKIPADSMDIKNLREKISLTKDLIRNSLVPTAENELESWKQRGLVSADVIKKEINGQKELTSEQKKWGDEKRALVKSTADAVKEFGQSETDAIKSEFEERQEAFKKYNLTSQKDISNLSDYAILTNQKIKEAEQKELSERLNNFNAYSQQIGGSITGLLSAFQNLFSARAKADIDALDAQLQAELEAAGVAEETSVEQAQRELDAATTTGDALAIEEKRRALTKAQIEEKYQKQKAKLEYENALRTWEFQRAIAALQIPLAVMNAVASGAQAPWFMQPWFMLAMGATAGITAGAQLAAVEASKPQAPKFASGGIIPGSAQGTQIIAGENNRTELVSNPDQMANILNAIGNGASTGGGVRQVPAMNKQDLFDLIFSASQNGDLFIAERAVTKR